MKKLLLLVTMFLAIPFYAQKAKSKVFYTNTYSIPNWYITKDYSAFHAKINLPEDNIQVFVNGKLHSKLKNKIQFNSFFNEDSYTNQFSNINGLTRIFKESNSMGALKIVANVLKPRINVTVESTQKSKMKKDSNEKFRYEFAYSYEIEFLIISDKTKKVLFKDHIEQSNYKYNFSLGNKERIALFDKREDAVNYAVNYIPKTLVVTDMYKSLMKELGGQSSLRNKVQFQNKNSFFYLYRLSKKKKHVLIQELNEVVKQFRKDTKKNNYKTTKSVNIASSNNLRNELDNLNKTHQVPYEYGLSKDYLNLVKEFEKSMNTIYEKLDTDDKIQKRIAWACMINNAHVFYSLGDFVSSLKYFDKAEKIDYNIKKTKAFKSKMLNERNKLDLFYEKDQLKKDVNVIYFGFLKSFRR